MRWGYTFEVVYRSVWADLVYHRKMNRLEVWLMSRRRTLIWKVEDIGTVQNALRRQ